jgi:hypothetical protein
MVADGGELHLGCALAQGKDLPVALVEKHGVDRVDRVEAQRVLAQLHGGVPAGRRCHRAALNRGGGFFLKLKRPVKSGARARCPFGASSCRFFARVRVQWDPATSLGARKRRPFSRQKTPIGKTMTTESDIAFIPAKEDVPTYMPPMLNDTDRNLAYEAAIAATLREFAATHGRAARVLDVGAGTGMLTTMALRHGAAHVTAIEANATVRALGAEQIARNAAALGRAPADWDVVGTLSVHFTVPAGAEPYDVVVSELLGSMLNSESQYVYLWDLLMRGVVRNFGTREQPRFYTVPVRGEMTLAAYACPRATGIVTGVPYAPMDVLHRAVYGGGDGGAFAAALNWTQDEAVRVMLAGDAAPLGAPVSVLRERYGVVSAGVDHPPAVELALPPGTPLADVVLVLEWTVELAEGVPLRHTLAHVGALPGPVRLARWVAWGHLFAPLAHCVPAPAADGRYRFTVDYAPAALVVKADLAALALPPPPAAAAPAAAAPAEADAGATEPAAEPPAAKRRIAPVRAFPGLAARPAAALEPVYLSMKQLAGFVVATKTLAQRGYTSI